MRRAAQLGLVTATLAAVGVTASAEPTLTRYDSQFYTIYTDLNPAAVREVSHRLTRMVEAYRDRTRSFTGGIRRRFPFYLYKSAADYHAAGGLAGTAGMYHYAGDGTGRLMAVAGSHLTADTWHVVQHEGFHQFAHEVIGGDFPTWLDEGLAEYFGEGLYTGDGFVTGVVPPWRLSRLQGEIRGGRLKPTAAIMGVSPEQWRAEMSIANYDQAWSMVYFLVHADGGRYQPALAKCVKELSQGRSAEAAWRDAVGSTAGFEDRWKAYWLAQAPSPTHDLYARATVATLTSFLARATVQRQAFPDLAAFVTAADGNALRVSPDDWLPPSLLSAALAAAHLDRGTADTGEDRWEFKPGSVPALTCVLADGTRMTGGFTLTGPRVAGVSVAVDDLAKVLADATAVRDGGQKKPAGAMVRAALAQNPRSPAAADARAFLRTCR